MSTRCRVAITNAKNRAVYAARMHSFGSRGKLENQGNCNSRQQQEAGRKEKSHPHAVGTVGWDGAAGAASTSNGTVLGTKIAGLQGNWDTRRGGANTLLPPSACAGPVHVR